MHHLDRRKTNRGQAVVALSAVLVFTAAGGGMGFWLGRYADGPRPLNALSPETAARDAGATASGPQSAADVTDITTRLGDMQAEVMRLNALGERLVEMSGLSSEEFNFQDPPPQGGPEGGPVRDFTIREIASELGSVVGLLKDRKRKLEILEEAIMERDLTAKSVPSGWPVRSGYITSNYGFRVHPIRGRRHFHSGVDFAAPAGSPVVAVADGLVTFSGRRNGYGNIVEVRHVDGYSTRYAHNSRNLVQEGQQVRHGQQIGMVGETGTATGPHVHFEVLKNGETLNPSLFVGREPQGAFLAANPANPG